MFVNNFVQVLNTGQLTKLGKKKLYSLTQSSLPLSDRVQSHAHQEVMERFFPGGIGWQMTLLAGLL
jgi:hypothetical protein